MPNALIKCLLAVSLLVTITGAHAMTQEEAALIANSAQRGSAGAQVLFAGIYKDGTSGYLRDERLAAYWYEQAAEQGNAYAQQMLSDLYEHAKASKKILRSRQTGVKRLPIAAISKRN